MEISIVVRTAKKHSSELGFIAAIAVMIILFNYRSPTPSFIYLSWSSGVIASILAILRLLARARTSRAFLLVSILSTMYLAWGLAITPFSVNQNHHVKNLAICAFFTVSSLLIANTIVEGKVDLRKFSRYLAALWAGANCILYVLFIAGIGPIRGEEFAGPFHDRNVFAITTNSIAVLYIASNIIGSNLKWRLSNILLLLALTTLVLVTKSITGLVGVVYILLMLLSGLSAREKIVILIVSAVLCGSLVLIDNPIRDRLDRFYLALTGQTDLLRQNESAYIRVFIINKAIEVAKDFPWVGVGFDNGRFMYTWPNREVGSFFHNNYLDIVTSGGVLLFAFYYVPYIYAIYLLLRWKLRGASGANTGYQVVLYSVSFYGIGHWLVCSIFWTTYLEYGLNLMLALYLYAAVMLRRAVR